MNRSFLHFVCDVAVFARWRLAPLGALTVLAALAEGGGLLMLVPVLQFLGIGGDQAPKWNGIELEEALALYVVLVAAATVVVAARGVAVTALRYRFVDHLRRQLHYAVAHMEWRAFGQLAAADITHVITNECSRSAMGFDFLLRTSGWAVEIPVLLMVAFHLSPSLTCAALFLAILCFLLTRPLNAITHRLGGQLGEAHRALQRDLTDNLNGMRVIRSFGIEAARHPERTRIDIVCGDASRPELPPGDLVLYLFHPFWKPTMAALIAGLEAAPAREPRRLIVVYNNPVLRRLLDRSPALAFDEDLSCIIPPDDERTEANVIAVWRERPR